MTDQQQIAEDCARALFERDAASQALGMTIESVGPGSAVVLMTVRADMANGHSSCHGGYIFTLADSAFAFACNSQNRVNVALSCSIDYLAPAWVGDRLRAVAEELNKTRKTGLTEIRVLNQDDEEVARFRGRSYQKNQPVIEESND
jgi:acyl-CoA thioesterase